MVADSVMGIDYPWPCDGSRDCDRHSATLPRGSRAANSCIRECRKRAVSAPTGSRLGKDRSSGESCHSIASAKQASPPRTDLPLVWDWAIRKSSAGGRHEPAQFDYWRQPKMMIDAVPGRLLPRSARKKSASDTQSRIHRRRSGGTQRRRRTSSRGICWFIKEATAASSPQRLKRKGYP